MKKTKLENPQVCSSVAAFHFIVQSLFSIRGILYASFFGFIFLKGIAEVSSGVSKKVTAR